MRVLNSVWMVVSIPLFIMAGVAVASVLGSR